MEKMLLILHGVKIVQHWFLLVWMGLLSFGRLILIRGRRLSMLLPFRSQFKELLFILILTILSLWEMIKSLKWLLQPLVIRKINYMILGTSEKTSRNIILRKEWYKKTNYNHLKHKSTNHSKCLQTNQSPPSSVDHRFPQTANYSFYHVEFGKTTQPTSQNVVHTYFARTISVNHPLLSKRTNNPYWYANSVRCCSKRKIHNKDCLNKLIIWCLPLLLRIVCWFIRPIHLNPCMEWAIFILLPWLILPGKMIKYLLLVVPMVTCLFWHFKLGNLVKFTILKKDP